MIFEFNYGPRALEINTFIKVRLDRFFANGHGRLHQSVTQESARNVGSSRVT